MRDLADGRFAVEVLGAPADLAARLAAARRRHAEHYRGVLAAADDLYLKGGVHVLSGLALFDLERRNIETGQAWASRCAADDPAVARLCVSYPNAGVYVLDLRQHPHQRIAWLQAAATAAREIGDRPGEANTLGNLGLAYAALGETRRAIELYQQDLVILREIGDRRGEGATLGNLGSAYATLGETRRAIELHEQALAISRSIGDRRAEGQDLGNLGYAYADLGETRRAIELYEQQLVIAREIGDRRGQGNALGNLGNAYAALGEPRRAIEFYEQQLAIVREIGDRRGQGNALGNLGYAYAGLGDTRRAIDLLVGALDIFEAIESPNAARMRAAIEELRNKGGT
jgi:tetratricopeptide (TPR) repeat protein